MLLEYRATTLDMFAAKLGTATRTAMKRQLESVPQLRHTIQDLQHELERTRAALAAATVKAETCQRSAREAWEFAQTMAKTGRRD